jgi:hypothetical protein
MWGWTENGSLAANAVRATSLRGFAKGAVVKPAQMVLLKNALSSVEQRTKLVTGVIDTPFTYKPP